MRVLKNKFGRGVYATRNYKKDAVVERAEVVLIPISDANAILQYYVFAWDATRDAIGLGFSSLYNHSKNSNLSFDPNHRTIHLVFKAKRDIAKGEELLINYGYTTMLSKKKAKFARGEGE